MATSAEIINEAYLNSDSSPYLPKGPLLRLIPGLGLDKMVKVAEKVGPRYWGLEEVSYAVPIVHDNQSRIIQLQKVLQKAPHHDDELNEWAFERRAEDIRQNGKAALSHKKVFQREKKGSKHEQPEISKKYEDLLTDPDIIRGMMGQLHEQVDYACMTVSVLEDWRLNLDEGVAPTTKNLIEGVEAFHLFLFGVRKSMMKEIVGSIAVRQFEEGSI